MKQGIKQTMKDFVIDNILLQSRPTLKELGVLRQVSTQWRSRVDVIIQQLFNETYSIPGVRSFKTSRSAIEKYMRTIATYSALHLWEQAVNVPMTISFLDHMFRDLRNQSILWILYKTNHDIVRNYKKNGPLVRRRRNYRQLK